jgi:hypothetical protein
MGCLLGINNERIGALKLGAIKLRPATIAEKAGDNQRIDPASGRRHRDVAIALPRAVAAC